MATLKITDSLPLPSSNVRIPQLGFGVYQSPPSQCTKSCLNALKAGYRHIDTAQYYVNESEVGEALKQTDIPRSEIFVTTKILGAGGSVQKSYQKCVDSIQKIDGKNGYVDLFLIHSAGSSKMRKEMWLALEQLYTEGKAKSIGVSNWGVGHIEEMKSYAKEVPIPHVNQIELHPWCQQSKIVKYCEKHKIVIEAYSPLVRNYKANDQTLVKMAKGCGKTTAQVLVRWCLQRGFVPLPKSDNPGRIQENADVYDFELSPEDMQTLDGLDQAEGGAIVQWVNNEYKPQ
jgi:diketogulonate reductase-like aldo/keto reductase